MLVSVESTAAVCYLLTRIFGDRTARDRTSVEESRARLEEIRYALDQAAIVAVTDQRGIITSVNDSGYHWRDFIRELWRTIAQGRI